MKLKSLKLNLAAVLTGVWFPVEDGARVRVAKWRNKNHQSFLTNLWKDNQKKVKSGVMTPEESDELMAGQWQFILTGMEGFTNDDDTPFVWSPESIKELAMNEQYEEFFKNIEAISKDEENFREETVAMLGKTSQGS